MFRHAVSVFIGFLLLIFIGGCATVSGPAVSQQEIIRAKEELMVKALDYRLNQLEKVSNIGYRLISHLAPNPRGKQYPYFGFTVGSIDKYAKRLFGLDKDRGLVVIAVMEDSPARKYGLKKGDIISAVDGRPLKDNISGFLSYIVRAPLDKPLNLEVIRQNSSLRLALIPKAVAISVNFHMVDMPEVNAAATADNYILYTYGMIKFAKSDDEIAIVLGHELAHLTRGHVAKMQGVQIFDVLLAIALGTVAESQSPGSGSAVMRGAQDITGIFSTKYSRDLENEADYFGILYVYNTGYDIEAGVNVWERFAIELPQSMVSNFLDTHPSSPERMLRIKKIIQELKDNRSPKTE